jgi:hypothetical protein
MKTYFIFVWILIGLYGTAISQETDACKEIMLKEARRTDPDYVVYVPGCYDGSTNDAHNEHFLVFDGPNGDLMAVWTQSPGGEVDPASNYSRFKNRIVFAKSKDNGKTWTQPTHIVGPKNKEDETLMASWGFPLVSNSGRIYVLWNQYQGVRGWIDYHTGTMAGCYSDDNGETWSNPQHIPMPHSPYDDPEGKIPSEWIVWQLPMKDLDGNYFVGYSRWANPKMAYKKDIDAWTQIESVVEFMRFTNIHQNPQPRDIEIEYSAWGEKSLQVPHWKDPLLSIAQEPSIVRLADDRLFCVMRTNNGYIWYSISADDGRTWSNPQPLLRKDHGQPILQPVVCCPLYQLADGRYVLIHHNHRGYFETTPEESHWPRRPVYIALGEYRPGAEQPIWFSRSKEFMDNDGYFVDGKKSDKANNLGVYTSFTTRNNENVLWHPDRKCILLGKKITQSFLNDLEVPSIE